MKTRKSLGLFEIEHIDDPYQVTIAVNPKEYIEKFESDNINKKHMGIGKNEISMDLSPFGKRTNSAQDIENFGQLQKDTVKQNRFTVKKNEMILESVEKSKFVHISDKRYYFEDGIISLTFSHPYLNEISKYKQNKEQKVESWIREEKQLIKNGKRSSLKKS